jgi:Gdp/GTP exchange factor required for growth at low temperatures
VDRDVFLGIRFQEFVRPDALALTDDVDVTDWAAFLKEKARAKAAGIENHRTNSLFAARARFNVLANFVISEIVMTPIYDRPRLFTKFVRIAWVSRTIFLPSPYVFLSSLTTIALEII